MIYAIPIIALLLILCAWLYRIARDAERQADAWKREAQGWEGTADRAMAERRNDIDAREALIEQLRRTRHEYLEHLVTGCQARSVRQLWRETWRN